MDSISNLLYNSVSDNGFSEQLFCRVYWCHVIVLSGIVGEVDKDSKAFYMWTHKKLDIGYNGDAIVDVNLTSEAKVKLEPGAQISFTYEVHLIC